MVFRIDFLTFFSSIFCGYSTLAVYCVPARACVRACVRALFRFVCCDFLRFTFTFFLLAGGVQPHTATEAAIGRREAAAAAAGVEQQSASKSTSTSADRQAVRFVTSALCCLLLRWLFAVCVSNPELELQLQLPCPALDSTDNEDSNNNNNNIDSIMVDIFMI
ncbi:uncharacterized protein LOC115767286 [Drosophila novamexicana]|uniref:uncharacterized protein LOC115767286 n=1 Tax=Drosophila novamexicana TaxID=47314 RepID=UPI0011E60718|nr:uncharacterized protein LOC115767286 [Drosophila novamexicana]